MRIYLYLLFLVAQVQLPQFAFSQKQLVFDHLRTENGLSQSNVGCFLQDSRGFMWFGTGNGLNKYDGYNFTIYRYNDTDINSLSNNRITGIVEDEQGFVWVGTEQGGLNRYDRKKNNFISFRNDPKNAASISSDHITSMVEGKQGIIWIGTKNGGLNMFNKKNDQFINYTSNENDSKSLSDAFVVDIVEDSQDNLWIGTGKGLNLFDQKNKTFTRFQHNKNDIKSIASNDVRIIFEDSRKNLWIGMGEGELDLLNKKTGVFVHYKNMLHDGNNLNNDLLTIAEDNDGNLWIGTKDGGLYTIDPDAKIVHNYLHDDIDKTSLSRNTISSIYKDKAGNMWMGIPASGIDFLNREGAKFTHYKPNLSKHSLSPNDVVCIYEDSEENVWIGTDGGGLNLFNRKSEDFVRYHHKAGDKKTIGGNKILSLCEDGSGNLWIGTWDAGITVFNKKNNTFKYFKNDPSNPSSLSGNNAWVIFQDREKNIWIGTYGNGLNLYNPDTGSFTYYTHNENNAASLSDNNVISIFEDSKGLLWVGTDEGGLNRLDKKTKQFTHFIHDPKKNSISDDFASSFFEDAKGNLWIGTGVGLNYFDTENNRFTAYTSSDGLVCDQITGIVTDPKANLWLNTPLGLSRFNPTTKKFKNFDLTDGLPTSELTGKSFFKSRTGAIYFGGVNSFNMFFPDSIEENNYDPPLVMTGFDIFNKEVPIALNDDDPSPLKMDITEIKEINLSYKHSVITFKFAALNYTGKEKKQYAYMLEGFDKTWNETGSNRSATYTNLDPRKYIFKVKVLKNNGEWSSHTITIYLNIIPPFWLTWWFRLCLVGFIIGSAVLFYRIRVNSIKTQKRKLQQLVHEQTRQLVQSTHEEQLARKETERSNIDLERKNKELEQFAYVASHDLQEPLRTTSSFIELIQKQYHGKLDDKADKYLDFISDASDRMIVLIKDLLDFSRIGTKAELKTVDCNIILKNVLTDIMVAIQESEASIEYTALPVINGYPTEIKLLFQNLVLNAIKFRKKDTSPQIKISAQKKGSLWQFAISDNCIGIEKKHSEKIFDIFQRLHTRKEYTGSGIGLSHCKKIVELHHGKIWVESIPGEGSTFYFALPAGGPGIDQLTNDGTKTKFIIAD
ncbi:MAG: two-component regulator propeller domain-containing protein [Ferruginibacter sp.]